MIVALENVTARGVVERGKPVSMLRNASFTWGSGVLAVMGTPFDGVSTLLGLVAGTVAPRSGRVLVEGRPANQPPSRVAYVPLDASLPEALTVEEICALSSDVRGEPRIGAAARLAVLGVEALLKRRASSLDMAEARSVLLAIALTSPVPVMLVEEPLSSLEPAAAGRALEAIRTRAANGACVIVTTSSVRDATRIADRLAVLTKGDLQPLDAATPHLFGDTARLRVVVGKDALTGPLVAALADDPAVAQVDTAARALRVTGRELVALAAAVTRAVATSGVSVEAIEPDIHPLDMLRRAPA